MNIILLLAQLFALGYPLPPPPPPIFQQTQQGPLPAHVRGPHEGEPGALCYPGPTRSIGNGRTLYECHCKHLCEQGAGGEWREREDDACVTACGTDQCTCHPEDVCPDPEAPKR